MKANFLHINEVINADETTSINYEVEAQNGAPVATGTELLRDGGCDRVRASLRAACIAHLEARFNAEKYDFPSEGVELPSDLPVRHHGSDEML